MGSGTGLQGEAVGKAWYPEGLMRCQKTGRQEDTVLGRTCHSAQQWSLCPQEPRPREAGMGESGVSPGCPLTTC